jgi:PPOX class probable F420-dependent enzyme
MALENEKYMMFTSFRKDGRPVGTPVWLVHLAGGEIGFSTGAESGKAKRLAHTAHVTLQACDQRGGKLHGPVLSGDARVVTGAELERIQAGVSAKYGLMSKVLGVVEAIAGRVGAKRFGSGRIGVIVHLDDSAPDAA